MDDDAYDATADDLAWMNGTRNGGDRWITDHPTIPGVEVIHSDGAETYESWQDDRSFGTNEELAQWNAKRQAQYAINQAFLLPDHIRDFGKEQGEMAVSRNRELFGHLSE